MSVCQFCKFYSVNVSQNKKEKGEFCTGLLGSGGAYTWNTPMWKNAVDEQWEDAIAALKEPNAKENGDPDCFEFVKVVSK